MSYCCSYTCGVCKIVCYMCCCKCCQKPPIVKEEFTLLALGLSGSGKSTLLSKVCGEGDEEIGPTKGFSIKDVSLATSILHVKEVGGSDTIRRYWHHYFHGAEGLIFVVDGSTNDEEIEFARNELSSVLSHRNMKNVPLLVLVNKTDIGDAESLKKLSDKLDIPKLCSSRSFIVDAYDLQDVTHLKMILEKFTDIIKRPDYDADVEDVEKDEVKAGCIEAAVGIYLTLIEQQMV